MKVRGLGLLTGFALIGISAGVIESQIMNLVLSQVLPERTSETAALMSTSPEPGHGYRDCPDGLHRHCGPDGGAITLTDDSTVIPEDLKPLIISAVDENARFLSNEELTDILKDALPDLLQEIVRINEISAFRG